MDDDVMPPEVLLRVCASIDRKRWGIGQRGENKLALLQFIGSFPEGVAATETVLAQGCYVTRATVGPVARELEAEGVIWRARGVGRAPSVYRVNPDVRGWSVPWKERNDQAGELVTLRAFHVEHQLRDNGSAVPVVARSTGIARQGSVAARSTGIARQGSLSRGPQESRDYGAGGSSVARSTGIARQDPASRAISMDRATTGPPPPVVVVPTSESGDEPSSSSREEKQKGGPDPVVDGLAGAIVKRVGEWDTKAFMVPRKRDQLRPLVDHYGAEHLHKLVRQIPPGLRVPAALDWLTIAAAPLVDVDQDEQPAFGMAESHDRIRIKLASLRSQLETYRTLDVDDDDEHLQDLLNEIATCENDLAATGEGATA